MAAVTVCSDFEAQENKCVTVSIGSPSICHEMMGLDAMILEFWILSFKPAFSLSFFTFIKRFFSSSLLSAIRVVSSAYLRLLIFLPEFLIPAYDSSSLEFCMIHPAYKLNKQGDNIQLWRTEVEIGRQYKTLRPLFLLFLFFPSCQVSISIFVPISRHSEEFLPDLEGHKTFRPRTRQSLTAV